MPPLSDAAFEKWERLHPQVVPDLSGLRLSLTGYELDRSNRSVKWLISSRYGTTLAGMKADALAEYESYLAIKGLPRNICGEHGECTWVETDDGAAWCDRSLMDAVATRAALQGVRNLEEMRELVSQIRAEKHWQRVPSPADTICYLEEEGFGIF